MVFEKTDEQHHGVVTEARLFDIMRELGLFIERLELTKFVNMVKVAVDDQVCGNSTEPPTENAEQARVGFVNYNKLLRRYQRIAPGSHVSNVIEHIKHK